MSYFDLKPLYVPGRVVHYNRVIDKFYLEEEINDKSFIHLFFVEKWNLGHEEILIASNHYPEISYNAKINCTEIFQVKQVIISSPPFFEYAFFDVKFHTFQTLRRIQHVRNSSSFLNYKRFNEITNSKDRAKNNLDAGLVF